MSKFIPVCCSVSNISCSKADVISVNKFTKNMQTLLRSLWTVYKTVLGIQ